MLSVAFVLPLLAAFTAALPPKAVGVEVSAHVESAHPETGRRRLPSVASRGAAVIVTKRAAFLR
jgi:hypothetical protein